jgi:PAS domain-containing protein/DNA-binding CsgD family transcriptional regulator
MFSTTAALTSAIGPRVTETFFGSLQSGLDRSRWQRLLGKISKSSRSDCCVLGISDLGSPLPTLIPVVRIGGRPSVVEAMRTSLAGLSTVPAGTLIVANDEHAARRKPAPQEQMSVVGVSLMHGDAHSLVLTACRYGAYQSCDTRFFERFTPRLSRLASSLEKNRIETIRSKALSAVFDSLPTAVFITDCDGYVFYANAAAEHLVTRGKALCVRRGMLTTSGKSSAKSLRDAIERICSGAQHHHQISIVVQSRGGQELLATVIPLTEGDRDNVLDAATAAVFVHDPDLEPLIPGEGFAKLYNLTACELSLLRSMLPGRCVKSAAEGEGISEATARSHLHHIFMKTGTNKQVELMKLFSSFALPILAEPEHERPRRR